MRGVKNEFHKRYDAECKRIQQELMKVPELQWMLIELEPRVVQRILVAAMIYQERQG